MLPDFGISEMIVVAVVALIVVGPKDLPIMMRKLGQFLARMRGIANEFRSSFDEMARQSELDELRREVEALRSGRAPYDPEPDRTAEITDVYSKIDHSVAKGEMQMHPPMSYQYSEEVIGLSPSAQTPVAAPAPPPPSNDADDDVYAMTPVAQIQPVPPAPSPAAEPTPAPATSAGAAS